MYRPQKNRPRRAAEATLLDGHPATTSWWLAPTFRARYPQVRLNVARMLVESGRRVTAGAAVAHLDLALSLVRRLSYELATKTARYLAAERPSSQAAFVIPDTLVHGDPVVGRFENRARAHLAVGFSLDAAAEAVGLGRRTLARRLCAVLGKTPLEYFQDIRVEHAVHRLRTSRASVDQIALEVGYRDGISLRALLRKKTGRGMRDLRLRE